MTLDEFIASIDNDTQPPSELSAPLLGVWHAERGDWDAAHQAVQDDSSQAGAWVHACLHREEGDLGNASYWYHRAGQPVAKGDFSSERRSIAAVLLAQ